MSFSRAFQWYHSHLDPIWPDGTFKAKTSPRIQCQSSCPPSRNQHQRQNHHRLQEQDKLPGAIQSQVECEDQQRHSPQRRRHWHPHCHGNYLQEGSPTHPRRGPIHRPHQENPSLRWTPRDSPHSPSQKQRQTKAYNSQILLPQYESHDFPPQERIRHLRLLPPTQQQLPPHPQQEDLQIPHLRGSDEGHIHPPASPSEGPADRASVDCKRQYPVQASRGDHCQESLLCVWFCGQNSE